MKVLLIITALFTLTGVLSATLTDASCAQKKSKIKEIEYQIDGQLTKKNDQILITILNYQELEDVFAESDDPTILGVKNPDENGVIIVTALVDENSANVIITAKNRQRVEIPLSITDKVYISVALDSTILWPGESTVLRILNISELKEPVIINEAPDNIQITDINLEQGTAIIKALKALTGRISINAKNAWVPYDQFISIRHNKTIYVVFGWSFTYIGRTITLTIVNIDDFVGFNLQFFSDPTGFVELGEIDDQGKGSITGIEVGSTTLKITADHTDSWSAKLDVKLNPNFEF